MLVYAGLPGNLLLQLFYRKTFASFFFVCLQKSCNWADLCFEHFFNAFESNPSFFEHKQCTGSLPFLQQVTQADAQSLFAKITLATVPLFSRIVESLQTNFVRLPRILFHWWSPSGETFGNLRSLILSSKSAFVLFRSLLLSQIKKSYGFSRFNCVCLRIWVACWRREREPVHRLY